MLAKLHELTVCGTGIIFGAATSTHHMMSQFLLVVRTFWAAQPAPRSTP